MSKEEALYLELGQSIKGAEESQMFGKHCFKIHAKAFVCFFENCMVFKLNGKAHETALGLKGSKLFDPSGKGRAMKEWVQVPFTHKDQWKEFANAAFTYVKT
ncbi:MAG: hypothetical protein JST26_15985 [Bacteroidetes bacterium]|nr:hypothetical protein [Bacteroidota bacterium]